MLGRSSGIGPINDGRGGLDVGTTGEGCRLDGPAAAVAIGAHSQKGACVSWCGFIVDLEVALWGRESRLGEEGTLVTE